MLRLLLRLVLFPGYIISQISFLFPGRGDLWASARRKDSVFAHFLISIPAYWLGYNYLVNDGQRSPAALSEVSLTGTSRTGEEVSSDAPSERWPNPERSEAEIATVERTFSDRRDIEPPDTKRGEAEGKKRTSAIESAPTADLGQTILDRPEVTEAIANAFASGDAEKWKSGDLKGYAVPSSPNIEGCRNVEVTLNGRSDLKVRRQICPSS